MLLTLLLPLALADDLPRCLGVEVLKADVNLRAKPEASGAVLAKAPKGARFAVTAVPGNEDWARISEGPNAGRHVSLGVARVIFRAEAEGCAQATASAETVGRRINIRAAASRDAPVAAMLQPGDALTVAPASGPWLRISWPEEHAGRFIHGDFVKIRLPMADAGVGAAE